MTQALARHYHPARRVVRRTSPRLFPQDFDRFLEDLSGGFGLAPSALAPKPFAPVFEASELEDAYRVTAELPGVDSADLDVSVEDGVLSIQGHRGDAGDESEETERFERRIRFPGEVVEAETKATYKNGLLTVTVPKPAEVKPEVRSIPIETA
jgi:HSP20 family protein